jgi:hypothetical protein
VYTNGDNAESASESSSVLLCSGVCNIALQRAARVETKKWKFRVLLCFFCIVRANVYNLGKWNADLCAKWNAAAGER